MVNEEKITVLVERGDGGRSFIQKTRARERRQSVTEMNFSCCFADDALGRTPVIRNGCLPSPAEL